MKYSQFIGDGDKKREMWAEWMKEWILWFSQKKTFPVIGKVINSTWQS